MDYKKYRYCILTLLLAAPLLPQPINANDKAAQFPSPRVAQMQPMQPTFAQPNMQAPGAGAMPELPPGVTQEQFDAALKEIDTFFNNMSEDEMKEFLNFVQDVESGKIDINELLPPGMTPPQPGAKPMPAPETKPEPMPEVRPQAPKPPMLRDKKAAQQMIADLIEHLNAVRVKAASYDLVARSLEPWNKKLDALIYYLHVITDKEHVEQLVSNKELLPLHDALKQLRDSLTVQEPLVEVPEFGLEKIEKAAKERSQKALKTILASFETFFTRNNGIAKLEQLMKLYEPELLKKRKEAEAAIESATREAQARTTMHPSPARIHHEAGYIAPRTTSRGGNGRFYDRYYTPEYTPSAPRSSSYERPTGGGGLASAKRGAEKTEKEEPKKEKKEAAGEKAEAGGGAGAGEQAEKPGRRAFAPKVTLEDAAANKLLSRMEASFSFVDESLNQDLIKKNLKTYFETEAPKGSDADYAKGVEQAQAVNQELESMTTALHRIAKDRGALKSRINKLSSAAKTAYNIQLKTLLNSYFSRLKEIYDRGLSLENKAYDEKEAAPLRNKIALHLGIEHKDVAPAYLEQKNNGLAEFMDAYELVYEPETMKERTKRKEEQAQKIAEEKAIEKKIKEYSKNYPAQTPSEPDELGAEPDGLGEDSDNRASEESMVPTAVSAPAVPLAKKEAA